MTLLIQLLKPRKQLKKEIVFNIAKRTAITETDVALACRNTELIQEK